MTSDDDKTKIFLPVEGVTLEDLPQCSLPGSSTSAVGYPKDLGDQSSPLSPGPSCAGVRVVANEEDIAIFRVGERVFAIQEKCPHAGGPLHLGDIEMLPDKTVCVRCPLHGWCIDLNTGNVCWPETRRNRRVAVYPVRVDQDKRICLGFDAIHPKYFQSEKF